MYNKGLNGTNSTLDFLIFQFRNLRAHLQVENALNFT